ncbi:MAG TPA: dipeptidase [Thermoguttaceae bacterium]|nr:dipeptidase [Thermoguttaceae bacterium]
MAFPRRTGLRLAMLLVACVTCRGRLTAQSESAGATLDASLAAKAESLHERVLTLDSHVDIAGAQYATDQLDPGIDHPKLKCDLVKMAQGGVDGVFLAVYIGQGPRDAEGYRRAFDTATARFEAIHRLVAQYPGRAELATSPDQVERIARTGKRAIMIGVENGYPIGTDLANVAKFYGLGARYVTLSHNGHNQVCDSCVPKPTLGDAASEHGGLSAFGREVVAEMNRLGMMIDVSHVAPESFRDVIERSKAPILASHSGCRALCDHPRNLDDAQLKTLARHGGVIQVVTVDVYLKGGLPKRRQAIRDLAQQVGIPLNRDEPNLQQAAERQRREYRDGLTEIDKRYPLPNLRDYVDHVDHAVRVAGIDHVGIGSDFDGGGGIAGFDDHSEAPNVTRELLRRGYSEQDVEKIWGGNLLRVWREVERVAAELQNQP